MKDKDIALIVVIVVISAVISLVISNQLISSPKNRKQKAEVVQAIDSTLAVPDKHYFNSNAFDPTKQITIEQTANPDPFSGTTQH